MAAPSNNSTPTSWFNSSFGSAYNLLDKSEQLQAATIDVPDCGICLAKVSDPIALKCGHIFDRHCIKEWLALGFGKCPYDRKDVKESEFNEQHDIYESTKCRIKAAVLSSIGSSLIKTDASIFSTMEKVQEKVISQYLKDSGKNEIPTVKRMTVRGSYNFYPGKTLADYQVMPGEEIIMHVILA